MRKGEVKRVLEVASQGGGRQDGHSLPNLLPSLSGKPRLNLRSREYLSVGICQKLRLKVSTHVHFSWGKFHALIWKETVSLQGPERCICLGPAPL